MLENKKEDVKDLATEAVIASLLPEENTPCKDQDKACTKRWLESLSDCA
jgi:hypothetical protein